jgi:hypothetical protein
VASFDQWETDGAIWFLDDRKLEFFLNYNIDVNNYMNSIALSPAMKNYESISNVYQNPRIKAQQGMFTWYRHIHKNFDDIIDTCLEQIWLQMQQPYNLENHSVFAWLPEDYGKWRIPAEAKPGFLRGLVLCHN